MTTHTNGHTTATAVHRALDALTAGRPIVVESAGTNSSFLVLAASLAQGEQLGWMVRHTSGFVLAATTADRLDTLDIPPMINRHGPAYEGFSVSVDACVGITTGISGHDRACTLRVLASPESHADDLIRPGHIMPICTDTDGVLARADAPEAAVDLMCLAGLAPVAAVCALVSEHGDLLDSAATARFATQHTLEHVRVTDVITHRLV